MGWLASRFGIFIAILSFHVVAHAAPPALAQETGAAQRDISYFARHDPNGLVTIDHGDWGRFLQGTVFNTGPSERRRFKARRNDDTGTRIPAGHSSRYAFEGNRVMFTLMTKNSRDLLPLFRKDLEEIATSKVRFHRLTRNEQLAFWLNLHNVVAIERIADIYPIPSLERRRIQRLIFDEKVVTIAGVPLSLNDIRLNIVYRYWSDPKVMYGFYLGVIGGPSLQTRAFTAANVDTLLAVSAAEFVNSLRGVEVRGGRLRISRLYAEARPYFFPDWPRDVRGHLTQYAQTAVAGLLTSYDSFRADSYSYEIADLAGGVSRFSRRSNVNQFTSESAARRGLPPQARQFIENIRQKRRRQGVPEGTVIIRDDDDEERDPPEEDDTQAEDGDDADSER